MLHLGCLSSKGIAVVVGPSGKCSFYNGNRLTGFFAFPFAITTTYMQLYERSTATP